MEQKEITKTRLIIYVLMAYGLTYLMGILMWYGSTKGYDLTVFPTAQMMYPVAGVIVLGVVWGLWHIPDDLFYYTKTSGIQMIFVQQITCISLGIFFAYAYMKTQNIWVPVCLHYLNNNLIPIISGTLSADVLENQNVSWRDLPVAVVLNGLCFGFFLLADVFKKKEIEKENS